MVSTLTATETTQGIVLRIHGDGDLYVGDVSCFLRDLEYAYNSAYVFDSILEEAEELYRTGNNPGLPIRNLLWMAWWPPTTEKVAAMVPEADRLKLIGVIFHSPGHWDFLGVLNPLTVLLQYLEARHNWRQDREFRDPAESRRLELENQRLELDLIERKIVILQKLGANSRDLALLKEQLLAQALRQLNPYQDRGLILDSEIVNPNIGNNDDFITPANLDAQKVVSVNSTGQITASLPLAVTAITERIDVQTLIHLVQIPSGEFLMGVPINEEDSDDSERPQHRVTVFPFLMSQFPITQQQWQAISLLAPIEKELNSNPSYFNGPDLPVERVGFQDAIEFCKRLSQATDKDYRLPSEAEWEYACRAGTTTPFYFGETITPELANYNGGCTYGSGPEGDYRQRTTEVGCFPPNAFGLYDMHGNVYEWCLDTWHDNYEGAPTDGSAWIDSNVTSCTLRGGCWDFAPRNCRSAYRGRNTPDLLYSGVGFRVVCSTINSIQ